MHYIYVAPKTHYLSSPRKLLHKEALVYPQQNFTEVNVY
jgi:hypothetical protein